MRASPLLLACLCTLPAHGQPAEFTYQGRLASGGSPATGDYDFEFRLYDLASDGTLLDTRTRTGVPVVGGLFTVSLDFPPSAFPGAARFLEIAVKTSVGPDPFVTLSPRQPLMSSPYAVRSLSADTATTATNATQLGGLSASGFIQNTTSPQTADFNISGNGVVGGTTSSNVFNAQTRYEIGGSRVLSVAGPGNTFVGVGTGASGLNNSFFGRLAGSSNSSGEQNSFFGTAAGRFNTTAPGNSFFGFAAGTQTTTGAFNSFFGSDTGQLNTDGTSNAFFGASAGQNNTTGSYNSFFGPLAGAANTTGNTNTFFGYYAGYSSANASGNAFFGSQAGQLNTGCCNAFFGGGSGESNTSGQENSFFGRAAGRANTIGGGNAFFGGTAGFANTTGTDNAFVGAAAGINNAGGSRNTIVGRNAGASNTGENNNTFLGYGTNGALGITNATAIGANAVVTTSNRMVLGTPAVTVHVPGSLSGDGSGLTNLNAQPKYVRTVVVSPVGTAAQNGTALLAALDGITTATAANPWLLKIEPGTYELGATPFQMKSFVDVEGSGENVTGITGVGSASNAVGIVVGAVDAELRFITVQNTGGAAFAKAIYLSNVNTVLNHVTAIGQGATVESQGVYLDGDTSTAVLSHVTALAIATGGARSFGLLCIGATASPAVRESTARGTGGVESHGVFIWGGATPLLWNVAARGTNATVVARGITIVDSAPVLRDVSATATGAAGAPLSDGIANFGNAAPVLERVTVSASGAGQDTGIYYAPGTVAIMNDVAVDVRTLNSGLAWGVNLDGTAGLSVNRLVASASGPSLATETVGVRSINGSFGTLRGVTATATNGATATGVHVAAGSQLTFDDLTVEATGGTSGYGIRNLGWVSARRVTATAQGGTTAYALANEGGAGYVSGGYLVAGNASGTNAGVLNANDATANLRGVTAQGTGGNFSNGIRNTGTPSSVQVDASTLEGGNASVANISASTVSIGASKLIGNFNNSGAGAVSCVGAYELVGAAYSVLNAICQ